MSTETVPLISIGASKDIDYIIRKLYDLEERLGGSMKLADNKGKGGDEFNRTSTRIMENIFQVRGKYNEMSRKRAIRISR